jgi:hypothetical protein
MSDDIQPETIKAVGKLDPINQLFREGATAVIIDVDASVCIRVGNRRYYFNPVIAKEEYQGLDDETHLRTILKYDGWEMSLAAPTTESEQVS